MIVASVAVFGPKYIESMFSITAKNAALIIGLAVFPTSLLGCLLGGWLIKKYNWLFRGQIRMVLFSLGFSWICMLMLMLTCPNLPMVGVTRHYAAVNETISRDDINLTASCNVHCSCGDEYDPVCGESNEVIYYSACHAGCQLLNDDDIFNKVTFTMPYTRLCPEFPEIITFKKKGRWCEKSITIDVFTIDVITVYQGVSTALVLNKNLKL
ncbi:putative solute carrier organic anion transporter family member 4A1 [Apostichopus japonicus]|uniref:Putative solute carrier organic anion transporter family member 4A1 n=1 Tax=Stichopus japonicus TaxID=307972 RepID=A0A2G8LAI0_STIJA|nr:putative solute carrier organic anion transporter family member 4A1 [Apostichopus japonicus]